ncbi:MAG: hypothetical protein GY853_03740 [PVC group bacterium]|nr:hypothetical protein [PVC group bacterium]
MKVKLFVSKNFNVIIFMLILLCFSHMNTSKLQSGLFLSVIEKDKSIEHSSLNYFPSNNLLSKESFLAPVLQMQKDEFRINFYKDLFVEQYIKNWRVIEGLQSREGRRIQRKGGLEKVKKWNLSLGSKWKIPGLEEQLKLEMPWIQRLWYLPGLKKALADKHRDINHKHLEFLFDYYPEDAMECVRIAITDDGFLLSPNLLKALNEIGPKAKSVSDLLYGVLLHRFFGFADIKKVREIIKTINIEDLSALDSVQAADMRVVVETLTAIDSEHLADLRLIAMDKIVGLIQKIKQAEDWLSEARRFETKLYEEEEAESNVPVREINHQLIYIDEEIRKQTVYETIYSEGTQDPESKSIPLDTTFEAEKLRKWEKEIREDKSWKEVERINKKVKAQVFALVKKISDGKYEIKGDLKSAIRRLHDKASKIMNAFIFTEIDMVPAATFIPDESESRRLECLEVIEGLFRYYAFDTSSTKFSVTVPWAGLNKIEQSI